MDIYKILKYFGRVKSKRLKILGIAAIHAMGRRYVGIFLDPVLACNLRCRMCYMSDNAKRVHSARQPMTSDELDTLARSMFGHALKLQIGCATEPTLYSNLVGIITKAKEYGVPYISITTNGQLIDRDKLFSMIDAGLNEITLSVHGLKKESYEYLMANADFDKFIRLIGLLKEAKQTYPNFKVRINYVINSMNLEDLRSLFDVLDGLSFDILQLRPFQDMGDTAYSDHDMQPLLNGYNEIIEPIIQRCKAEKRTIIAPSPDNIIGNDSMTDAAAEYIESLTYYYVSPGKEKDSVIATNHHDYNLSAETFSDYHRRNKSFRKMLLKTLFPPRSDSRKKVSSTKKLNYKIK